MLSDDVAKSFLPNLELYRMSTLLLLFAIVCQQDVVIEVGPWKAGGAMWSRNKWKTNSLEILQRCRKTLQSHLQTNAGTYGSVQQCFKHKVSIKKDDMLTVNN